MAGDLWFWSVQHSVGQGLMHSGVLADGGQLKKSGENLLSVVYDCGTLTGKRKKLIRREVDLLASRIDSLDALYISHFDDDHVNGLPELFDRFTPSLIAIPHVTAAERFFRVVHARGGYGLGALGEVTRGMLVSPRRTIREMVGRIPKILEIKPYGESPLDRDELPNIGVEAMGDGFTTVKPSRETDGVGYVISSLGDHLWVVKPWVQPAVSVASKRFLKELGLSSNRELTEALPGWLSNIRDSRKFIADAYKRAIRGVSKSDINNFTSLCLYSGPPNGNLFTDLPNHWAGDISTWSTRGDFSAESFKPAWVGTGDALLGDSNAAGPFFGSFSKVRGGVGQVTVPHHGASRNSYQGLVDFFGHGTTWIASAGSNNKFGHPHRDVVEDISQRGQFVWVTENSRTRYIQTTRISYGG